MPTLTRYLVLCLLAVTSAFAQSTLIESSGGAAVGYTGAYFGQSFSVPTGFEYEVTALILTNSTSNGLKLYVFNQPYAGTPNGLASASTGLIETLTAAGGKFTFATPIHASSGATFYFYGSGYQVELGSNGGGSGGIYNGGLSYFSNGSASPFQLGGDRDLHFSVLGSSTASAIPEPSTYAAMAGLGALGLVAWKRRTLARESDAPPLSHLLQGGVV